MKKFIVILLLACAVVGGVYYLAHKRARANVSSPELTVIEVERGPIILSVSTTGRVVANREVEIKCKASGEVTRLPYDVSDRVRKGDLIVELDPVDEQRMVKQAEVSLSASQARLAKARQTLLVAEKNLASQRKRAEAALKSAEARAEDARAKSDRMKHLLEKEFTSQERWDTAETAAIQADGDLENARTRIEELETEELSLELKRQDVRLAEAEVKLDEIALLNAQQRLQDTRVFAPIDGVVSTRNVEIGRIIASGISNVGGGTTVLTLADLSRLFILASVDESDIGKVEVGQTATITVDAFPETVFSGQVMRTATKGVNTSGVVTFEAKVEVLGQNRSLLRPEMTANMDIVIAQKEETLLIPTEAVSHRGQQHVALVIKENGATEERPVEVGISDGINLEIINGLSEGESVVVAEGEAESRWRNRSQRTRSRGSPGPMMFGRPRRSR